MGARSSVSTQRIDALVAAMVERVSSTTWRWCAAVDCIAEVVVRMDSMSRDNPGIRDMSALSRATMGTAGVPLYPSGSSAAEALNRPMPKAFC